MMFGRGQTVLFNFQLANVASAERRAHSFENYSDTNTVNTKFSASGDESIRIRLFFFKSVFSVSILMLYGKVGSRRTIVLVLYGY